MNCPPHMRVPFSSPNYIPQIDYRSDLFGFEPSLNTSGRCVSGADDQTQYPYVEQDHLALARLARARYVRPRTLDGITVQRPVDEKEYSCECSLGSSPWSSKFNGESLRFEVKGGVLKRGCDCLKRNGLQDDCPRARREGRWRTLAECARRPRRDPCPKNTPPDSLHRPVAGRCETDAVQDNGPASNPPTRHSCGPQAKQPLTPLPSLYQVELLRPSFKEDCSQSVRRSFSATARLLRTPRNTAAVNKAECRIC